MKLGWVHSRTTEPREMALMVQSWLKKMYWARVNLVIAGITQLLAEKEHIEAVLNEASKVGAYDLIKRLQNK
jgi:hypothetical protein